MSKKNHMSRLSAPRTWPIKRKERQWISKPKPGAHSVELSLPLSVVLKEILNLAETNKQVKYLILNNQVLLNKRHVKEMNIPVGLFDVISVPSLKKHYRMIISKSRKLKIIEIPEKESNITLLRIDNKKILSNKRVQLNFMNG
jgi:small subunit ribosomal protein S4e